MALLLLSLSWNRATNAFTLQSQTTRQRPLIGQQGPFALHLFFADEADNNGSRNTTNGMRINNAKNQVPFVIERISETSPELVFQEVADMCIDVFFNDAPNTTPWKQVQLSYLRNLQKSDLHSRKTSRKLVNDMFVARRVLPVSQIGEQAALKKPIVLDLHTIYNLPHDTHDNEDFVRDDVIGFVEVTEKQFGLGQQQSQANDKKKKELRPVLTNLAVHPSYRKAGVGSQLLQACEAIVAHDWKEHDEIVLEVEDDNPKALAFYDKRGYKVMFEDSASRRYDVNGFFLQKKQCTKICMRKVLNEGRASSFLGSNLLQTLRESVFSK